MKRQDIKTAIEQVKAKGEKKYATFSTKIKPEISIALKRIQKKENLKQGQLLEVLVISYYKDTNVI